MIVTKRAMGRSALFLLTVSCVGACGTAQEQGEESEVRDADYDGIGSTKLALLTTNCTLNATTGMTIAVNNNETAYFTLRPSDGMVTVNAIVLGGAPCEQPATLPIAVTTGTVGNNHSVILDYVNGLWGKATVGTTQLVSIDFTGSADTVKVRGSSGVDKFYLGKSTATLNLLNINGGSGGGLDAFPDVKLTGVENIILSAGPGADTIDGLGLFGTTAAIATGMQIFGGDGDDAINGGLGNDVISGDLGNDATNGGEGNDTYKMGKVADGNDTFAMTGLYGSDTADYSARTANLTLTLDGVATGGAAGELDVLSDKILTVIGGSGDDSITIGASSVLNHTVKGGLGNDTLTGTPLAADLLVGGLGDANTVDGDDIFVGAKATADYTGRAVAMTVTINSAGAGGADANDGDQTSTRIVQAATAAPAGTITAVSGTLTGLSGMTAKSVGRTITITLPTIGANAGVYPILTYISPSSVTVDMSGNGAAANDTGFTWSEKGVEKDEVRCANVIGSAGINTITGDLNDNRITGGAANDLLNGGAGNDTLNGMAGDDTLHAGAGEDTLIGGAGIDTLVGGDGNDILQGDAGNDIFSCDAKNLAADGSIGVAPGNADFMVDFTAAGDTGPAAAPTAVDCEF